MKKTYFIRQIILLTEKGEPRTEDSQYQLCYGVESDYEILRTSKRYADLHGEMLKKRTVDLERQYNQFRSYTVEMSKLLKSCRPHINDHILKAAIESIQRRALSDLDSYPFTEEMRLK